MSAVAISAEYSKTLRHIAISVAIFAGIQLLLPPVNGLTEMGVTLLAIFIATVYLWIFVAVDWPSLLAPALIVAFGIVPHGQMLQFSMGNLPVAYVFATSLLTVALERTGAIRQAALWFMTRKICEGRPWVFLGMFLFSATFLEFWVDIVPLVLIYLALSDEVCQRLGYEKGSKFGQAIVFGILVLTVISYGATPIASPGPLIMLGFFEDAGFPVTFGQYMAVGIPFTMVVFVFVMLILRFVVNPDMSNFNNFDIEELRREMKPLDLEGKITVTVFILVIVAWLMPDITRFFAPRVSAYFSMLFLVPPALFGIVLLSIIRVKDDKPILNIKTDIAKTPLGVIVFIVGVQTFANTINSPDAGIRDFMSNSLMPLADAITPAMFIWVAMAITVLITQTFSNIVLQSIMWFAFLPVMTALNVDGVVVNIVAFGILISLACNIAFVLPPSQVCAPMCFGSGYLEVSQGIKYGVPTMIGIYILLMLVAWPLALWVAG